MRRGSLALFQRTEEITAKLLRAPELKDLSDAELEQVAKSVVVDELKKQLSREVAKRRIDVEELRSRWLNKFNSPDTKRTFRNNTELFLHWLGKSSILDVNAKIVDDYLIFLKSSMTRGRIGKTRRISSNTYRLRVAACSSFWKSLNRWQVVDNNPWLGANLPKKPIGVKKAEAVPTDRDLDYLEQYCTKASKAQGKGSVNRQRGAQKALAALWVLRATGMRVGALPSFTADANGYYTAKSKGGEAQGRLGQDVLKQIRDLGLNPKHPFEKYASFAKWFERTCRAFGWKYSVHGIRHRFATNHYNLHRNPLALQKLLGHSSLVATEAYLATLKTGLN